ncbi:hypothetical protein Pint_02461 [Pistacia integerrima]|uniref:Uncharacterized protein n=1 Tax=Pistacia integerrima TaxID=434235 RepID=A0ACC0ZKK0_9ROSI|nr:hypothetical protein Pint_02461 [Pistacia integerrima]
MAFQSPITSIPRSSPCLFPCKSLFSKASCSRPSFINYSSRSFSCSPRNLTSGSSNLPLVGPKSNRTASFRCFASALTPELKSTLDKVVTSHKVVLFMKGTKDFPQCGFSHTVVQILKSLNVPFETINILENEMLRQGLKEYSSWPTFPQLYIEGEFYGGCDITVVNDYETLLLKA